MSLYFFHNEILNLVKTYDMILIILTCDHNIGMEYDIPRLSHRSRACMHFQVNFFAVWVNIQWLLTSIWNAAFINSYTIVAHEYI